MATNQTQGRNGRQQPKSTPQHRGGGQGHGQGQAQGQHGQIKTDNATYNVVSVLYHSLQGVETYQKYRQDAERAGDRELLQFIDQVIREENSRAERAKRLLAQRIGGARGGKMQAASEDEDEDIEDEVDDDDEEEEEEDED